MCVSSLSLVSNHLYLISCYLLVMRSRLVEGVGEVKWMLCYSGVCDTGGV